MNIRSKHGSEHEIELVEITNNQQATINDLPDELISQIQSLVYPCGTTVSWRFFKASQLNLPRIAKTHFENLCNGNITISSLDDAIKNLRLTGACLNYYKFQFEDERIKLARAGILVIGLFQTLNKLAKLGGLTFTVPEVVRKYQYIPAVHAAGMYQWIDEITPVPIDNEKMLALYKLAEPLMDTLDLTDASISLNDLMPIINQLNDKLAFSLKEARHTQTFPRLIAFFKPSEKESAAEKALRLVEHTHKELNTIIKMVEPEATSRHTRTF